MPLNLFETLTPRFLRSAPKVRINKPVREIAIDLTFFVVGVVILYGIDLTIISHSAPLAIQYMVQFCLYLNHHAVAAVETVY